MSLYIYFRSRLSETNAYNHSTDSRLYVAGESRKTNLKEKEVKRAVNSNPDSSADTSVLHGTRSSHAVS